MSASKLCFIATLIFAVATIIISTMMGTPPAPAIPGALAATFLSGSNGHVAEFMGLTLLPFMLSFPIAAGMYLRPSRET